MEGGGCSQTQKHLGDIISLHSAFQKKEKVGFTFGLIQQRLSMELGKRGPY
jgi:hypothetical protein